MKQIFPLFLVLTFMLSCTDTDYVAESEESFGEVDCGTLVSALLEQNSDLLRNLLNPELENYNLFDQDNDACIHDNNLSAIAENLSNNCNKIVASVVCCGCIDTSPPISEISIQIDSSGFEVIRILDLLTPFETGEPLLFEGIHL